MNTREIVEKYFDAIRNRDSALLYDLFAKDAVLNSGGISYIGNEVIASWYKTQAFAIEPEPALGPFIVDGDHLAVEIDLHTSIGRMLVCDIFETKNDKIERLSIYGVPTLGE